MNTIEERLLQTPAGQQWKEIGVHHHHGICLPLFSIRSENSGGIGEYPDLIPLIRWCKEIGMDIIQLLPLNDTGLDPSPYNAISAFALNPIHISLKNLPFVNRVSQWEGKIYHLNQWNKTSRVKYGIVRELKRAFLKEYYHSAFEEISQWPEYKAFIVEHKKWIEPFALFKSIKETQEWRNWEDWPEYLKNPSQEGYEKLLNDYKESVNYHILVQFLCYRQFEEVKAIANQNHVFIKGDIPILISRDSADVWAYRPYFSIDLAAGAPPDMYSKDGQYWGFPLYDWNELEKQDYEWWRLRLQIASHLYHLYRIDHVVGFFRIWGIPLNHKAIEGSFVPHDKITWIPHGRKIMEMMLKTAPILPIGEDLGVVPPEVRICLAELGICGTKMMRWERRWETDASFIPSTEYHPESMTTVSTHDSDTLQLWWRHFPKEAKLFAEFKGWAYKPFLTLDRHREILWDSHHSGSLFHINLLQEYLALFHELAWPNPSDERINIPGKILDSNWTYKFRPSLEELLSHSQLKQTLKELIQ